MDIKENRFIFFCIVLYNQPIVSCLSFLSLLDSLSNANKLNLVNVKILLFDNSQSLENYTYCKNNQQLKNIKIEYYSLKTNVGIPKAYNYLRFSQQNANAKDWFCFFDQDTFIPLNYVDVLLASVFEYENQVGLFVPYVKNKEVLISPSKFLFGKSFKASLEYKPIITLKNYSFINSGLTIKVDLFDSVNGYNESIFLDMADHEFISRVKRKTSRFCLLPITLSQNLSSINNDYQQSIERYKIFVRDIKQLNKSSILIGNFFLTDVSNLLRLVLKFRSLQFLKIRFF